MFDKIERADLNELHFRHDKSSGLRAIIAIHNTRLGPALGGCRFITYDSDDDAIEDVIRLARGMSYKAAIANVPQGGGKAVILKPLEPFDRQELFQAFGSFIHDLGGRYITAVDSGSLITDMDEVALNTPYVSGTTRDGHDPSPVTALGVYAGICAAVQHQLGRTSLKGLRIAVQGLGNVGYALAALLHKDGARLIVSDIDERRVQRCVSEFGAEAVDSNSIYGVDCDLFAPCGLGGVINARTIPQLRCSIVAGAANNQLSDDGQGEVLHKKGILYAPDYVINAGGLIQVSLGYLKKPASEINQRTLALGGTLTDLFERSRADNVSPEQIANRVAESLLFD
ncbi:MAG: Glu/Leu/Phe/Val dehydrogenase dimerization domain-containing protein [Pseudohongiella sp.]|uniref:Glu/Leu/Phe/Val dehydrogenase family protein n=1 Tax=Pseudohongiella sp. TaxID=1979412 RepID=UPI0034A01B40